MCKEQLELSLTLRMLVQIVMLLLFKGPLIVSRVLFISLFYNKGQKVICACLCGILMRSQWHWRNSVVVSSGVYWPTNNLSAAVFL